MIVIFGMRVTKISAEICGSSTHPVLKTWTVNINSCCDQFLSKIKSFSPKTCTNVTQKELGTAARVSIIRVDVTLIELT